MSRVARVHVARLLLSLRLNDADLFTGASASVCVYCAPALYRR
jgi:hypothetical protein